MIKAYYFEILLVTFWHGNCLHSINQLNYTKMKELINQYNIAQKEVLKFMRKGQINAYFDALIEMNHYKKLMIAVQSN